MAYVDGRLFLTNLYDENITYDNDIQKSLLLIIMDRLIGVLKSVSDWRGEGAGQMNISRLR